MSHETVTARTNVYVMPMLPSDVLRSLEFTQLFERYHGPAFRVRTRDGWDWSSSRYNPAVFTATFNTRDTLDAVIDDPTETTLGRVFLNGELDIQGDLFALLSVAEYVFRRSGRLNGGLLQIISHASRDLSFELPRWIRPDRRKSATKSWNAITCPCDLPVEFFHPWLGPSLDHSCAQFGETKVSLEVAQRRGLEHVCSLLELESGDRLLDVSCGWGSLLLHAAERYRADSHGITLSERQAAITSDRIQQKKAGRQCAAECRDLRTAPYRPETFDKVANIGIFEQVGFRQLREYFNCINRTLTPGGLFLAHRMTCSPQAWSGKGGFLDRDMFPQGELAPLSKELEAAESAGFEVRTVQGLRGDYTHTLRFWIANLQRNAHVERRYASERSYRRWLLYLTEVAAAFEAGDLEIHEMILRRAPQTYPASSTTRSWYGRRSVAQERWPSLQ